MTCNQLIKENKKIISNFEKFIKTKLQDSNDADNYEYINAFCNSLYTQINETIIKLDQKECTIIESDYLKEHLKEMVILYFMELEADKKYTYWWHSEDQAQDYFDYENSFIEPNKFTSEYVFQISKTLNLEIAEKSIKKIVKEKSFADYFYNIENKEEFLDNLKNEFKTEKGVEIRIIIEILKDKNLLIIGNRKFNSFYNELKKYLGRDIGTYQSINDIKFDGIRKHNKQLIGSIEYRLDSILEKLDC